MAQTKKRPSKAAKTAQKILAESKLLAANKAPSDAAQIFKGLESAVKPSVANKPRPDKKRG